MAEFGARLATMSRANASFPLGDSGIDTSGITVVQGTRSAVSTILIDDEDERLIVPFYDLRV